MADYTVPTIDDISGVTVMQKMRSLIKETLKYEEQGETRVRDMEGKIDNMVANTKTDIDEYVTSAIKPGLDTYQGTLETELKENLQFLVNSASASSESAKSYMDSAKNYSDLAKQSSEQTENLKTDAQQIYNATVQAKTDTDALKNDVTNLKTEVQVMKTSVEGSEEVAKNAQSVATSKATEAAQSAADALADKTEIADSLGQITTNKTDIENMRALKTSFGSSEADNGIISINTNYDVYSTESKTIWGIIHSGIQGSDRPQKYSSISVRSFNNNGKFGSELVSRLTTPKFNEAGDIDTGFTSLDKPLHRIENGVELFPVLNNQYSSINIGYINENIANKIINGYLTRQVEANIHFIPGFSFDKTNKKLINLDGTEATDYARLKIRITVPIIKDGVQENFTVANISLFADQDSTSLHLYSAHVGHGYEILKIKNDGTLHSEVFKLKNE